ncbi:MAG: hypothetical protein PHD48_03720 [Alphaproteobacteria bacterium]|nr:hypothetical protein [Alphaproteobacteria bacterium]
MGEDYWGPETAKNVAVYSTSFLLALYLTQASCTQHPRCHTNTLGAGNDQAVLTSMGPAPSAKATPTVPFPSQNGIKLTISTTTDFTALPLNYGQARRDRLISQLSSTSRFTILGARLFPAKSIMSENLAYFEGLWAMPIGCVFEPIKFIEQTPSQQPLSPKPKTTPKKLSDHVGPKLKAAMKRQKAHVAKDAPLCLVKAKTLLNQIHKFEKVEAIWDLPAIFFITTSYIESSWGINTDNLLQNMPGPFADQLRSAGRDMIETMTDEDKNPKRVQDGTPIVNEKVLSDLKYAVALMNKCNGRPIKPAHIKAARESRKNTIIAAGLTAEYIQDPLDEALNNLCPKGKELADLMRNGLAYGMINVGAPGILDMTKHLNAKVNTRYIDTKKQRIFGIDPKTDTNRSALMKIITKYTATEEAITELLVQKDMLPKVNSFAYAFPTQPIFGTESALLRLNRS